MKTNPRMRKLLNGFWIVGTVVLFLGVQFLFAERFFWKWRLADAASNEGRLGALEDARHEQLRYLVAEPNGYFEFTGDLEDGIEIWSHAYTVSFPFSTPFRVSAETYVSTYNGQMKGYVRGLDVPPSAVEHRSAELSHEDYKVRERAAKFLGMMGVQAEDAVPSLIVATRDEYAEVRARAAWALGKVGPGDYRDEVVAALESVRELPNSTMQGIASRALKEVSAKSLEPREALPE